MRGSEFRALRTRAKLTQQQAAVALGVVASTVFRWEGLETVPVAMGYALQWITKDAAAIETDQEKAERELAKRKSTELAWSKLPPWSEEERTRRQRLGLPMNEVDVRAETERLYNEFTKT